ncbi:C1 family peptidase [Ideonella sp. 4Y11]|uniref:C1 family peptidase n=1 Tax=Ideonella aquatica TaxID=2824119 RepID=A0A941BR55_9BURK|nr:C1 family peptidase [Ideonella aquatica]MBQ0959955.1 C1 family peptidase [Ideonella aquatica]
MTAYLNGLLSEGAIGEAEFGVLIALGPRSAAELYALCCHFTGLLSRTLPRGDVSRISFIAARDTALSFRNTVTSRLGHPRAIGPLGASAPSGAFPAMGQPHSGPGAPGAGTAASLRPIDHHTALRRQGWPVRDQGDRGTCVAHALVAAWEQRVHRGGAPTDYSEQFVFWSAKQADGDPGDGTQHAFALQGLQSRGICKEADWPYDGNIQAGSVDHGPPPPLAVAQASAQVHAGGGVRRNATALGLYKQLLRGPVAIGLPVYADPMDTQFNNWNVPGLYEWGIVAQPPLSSIVIGGHAVCVVGFEPDPDEPSGNGWFIIRNSWGADFGQQLPGPAGGGAAAAFGPEPGYGQVSWDYVDARLWEVCWL